MVLVQVSMPPVQVHEVIEEAPLTSQNISAELGGCLANQIQNRFVRLKRGEVTTKSQKRKKKHGTKMPSFSNRIETIAPLPKSTTSHHKNYSTAGANYQT